MRVREIIAPFPRLRYRLRTGLWCEHPAWQGPRADGWRMIDLGRRQMRRCTVCEWTEFR